MVDELEPGVWSIKTAQVIPDNERWQHTPDTKQRLDEAFAWFAKNPPQETDLGELERKLTRRLVSLHPDHDSLPVKLFPDAGDLHQGLGVMLFAHR